MINRFTRCGLRGRASGQCVPRRDAGNENFLILCALCCLLFAQLPLVAAERPNVVFFLIDDLGWSDVGFHGSEIKTPNIDKLAAAGARLEAFYVQPVCSPTRAALMTGRYPMRHGLQVGVVRPV